ncbi:MAG TPA: preprotein translocase subunit SecG, partial [Victivallales bacterium]|nr:preprotein translocase subunit SecG [Victivallales bacterium]
MQNFLVTVLMAADVFIALIIIALVLVQQSKEGALGGAFGGVGESVFGAQAGGHLTKLTVIFSVLFLSITLALAIIIGHRAKPVGLMDRDVSIKESKSSEVERLKDDSEKSMKEIAKEASLSVQEGKKEAENLLNEVSDVLQKKEDVKKSDSAPELEIKKT